MQNKPINDDGMVCPFLNRYTAKACHNCALWMPLNRIKGGQPTVEWHCAIRANVEFANLIAIKTDEQIKATQQTRNAFLDFKDSLLRLFQLLVGKRTQPTVIENGKE